MTSIPLPTHPRFRDLTGQKFGRLTCVSLHSLEPTKWNCVCECGKTAVAAQGNLCNSHTNSCGCLLLDVLSVEKRTHGLRKHPLYSVWNNIKTRCLNPVNHRWDCYGGRGIKICDRWKDSFENFYTDMAPGYRKGLQIDRIDNDGGYCPENCRWATPTQNVRNTRTNRLVATPWGVITVAEAAELSGLPYDVLLPRARKGDEGARLLRPVKKALLHETPWGMMTLSEAAKLSGLRRRTLEARLEKGDTGDRLFRPVAKRKAA
jgi:hypothetical protein